MTRTTFQGIQYLRGIAALMVVVYHANGSAWWAHAGAYGVDIFFVISGFLMVYTTSRTAGERGDVRASVRFLQRRAVRVVPLYWIALTVSCLLGLRRWIPDARVLLDYLFIPHFHPLHTASVFPALIPGWTLNFEMFFYLVFAVCMLAGRLSWLVCCLSMLALATVGAASHPTSAIGSFYTNPLVLEFGLGIVVARAHLSRRWVPSRAVASVLVVVAFGVLLVPKPSAHGINYLAAAAIVYGMLYAQGGRPLAWLDLLGDASYALYVFHSDVIGVAHKLLLDPTGISSWPAPWSTVVSTLCSAGLCIAVGVIAHRRIEQPLAKRLRHWGTVARSESPT